MNVVLNIALITLLGLSAGACTVVTDPSSASSGGSSSDAAFLNRQQRIAEFTSVNLEQLRNDIAAGQGEYLGSLAELMGVETASQPAFFAFSQEKFTVLFPGDRTTAAEMLAALNRELRADSRFDPRLALN